MRKSLRAIQIRSRARQLRRVSPERLRRPVGMLIVVVGIVGLSLQATASTRLDRPNPQAHATSGQSAARASGRVLRHVNSRLHFAAAEKIVICHSTSSDTNPYNRIVSAGTAGHDPTQGTHDLDLFGPNGDETFQCPGLLGIMKVCTDGVTGTFTLHITNTYRTADATRTISCGERIRFAVNRGTVSITEDVPAGVTASFGGHCTQDSSSTGHTTIGASSNDPDIGEAKECSVTNAPRPTTVNVTKSCPSGADASSDLFNVVINSSASSTNLACGESHMFTVSPGSTSVTEAAAGTTNLANYTQSRSGGCDATLAQGDAGSCTLTNTVKANQELKVVKDCPAGPDASGDRFKVVINGNPTDVDLACGDNHVFAPAAGNYTITEAAAGTANLANYTQSSSGCGNLTLARGGSQLTCTLTNTLKTLPTVAVTKDCVPNADDSFQVTNNGANIDDPLACEGQLTVTLQPGAAYNIDEAAGNATTDLANYTSSRSSGCTSANGLPRGDSATCTITNTLKAAPKVTVNKACPNGKAAAGDRFQVKRNGSNVGSPLDCGGSLDVTVTAGQAYALTEAAAGTTDLANYNTSSTEGCSGTLAHFGDTASCTITNALKPAPKLTVIKHVVNDSGGTKSAGDFTLTVSGSTPSPASFPGSESGTVVTLQPGPYAVNEAPVSGYTGSKSAGCSGTLSFGDTATCTVNNDDIASPPPPTGPPLIDLAITKTDAPDPVSVGALLTYTLTVTNKKGDTANNVVVTDSLPSEVTLVSIAATKGTCSGTVAITCNLGTVAYHELVTITIVVRPSAAGTITNIAVVAGREAEHNPSDNTASAATLVQGPFAPPSVCYTLRVTPKSLTVGRRSIIRAGVREAGTPVRAVQVVVTGKGMSRRARTNKSGIATVPIRPTRPGILLIRVPTHATCNRQRIGVVGVFTPPVTG
jgi:uncharacterized repeat protein (TIGR01451 family)